MRPVDNNAGLTLAFMQSMNFAILKKLNINLETLQVVTNEVDIVPAIELTVISRYRKDEIVQISSPWTFTNRTMKTSVNFTNPSISAEGIVRDTLQVKINARYALVSASGNSISDDTSTEFMLLENYIERQNMKESSFDLAATKFTIATIIATSWVALVLVYFSNRQMNSALGVVGDMSFMLHNILIDIQLLPFLQSAIDNLMKLASFEPYPPIENKLNQLYGEQTALAPIFGQLGYESPYLLHNNGSATFLALLFPITAIIYWLLSKTPYNSVAKFA